jgi:hypothetical protein
MESRDFSDFEAGVMDVSVFPDEAPLRLDAGADRAVAFRLGAEMRFWDLETNKDRRVGVMFKAPSCARLLSQSKSSSTGGEDCVVHADNRVDNQEGGS